MCFYIEEKNRLVKTAKRAIVVYKRVEKIGRRTKTVRSEHQYMVYELGRLYKTTFGKHNYFIAQGFHSYTAKRAKTRPYGNDGIFSDDFFVKVRCHIPKGTRYYKNVGMGEYVSNQITVKEIITKQ